jgi:hypothetical protein
MESLSKACGWGVGEVARPEGSERAAQTLHVEGVEELVRALQAA